MFGPCRSSITNTQLILKALLDPGLCCCRLVGAKKIELLQNHNQLITLPLKMEIGEAAKPKKTGGRQCSICNQRRPALKRPKTLEQICRECFYAVFEDEIHKVIVDNKLFKSGERIGIGASGGKDSTVLAYVLSELNRRHNYGLDLFLLSVDEGITGYRDDSLETVKRNELQYGLPLKVVSYKDLYGWTMDEIVKMIGLKNNCTFCGVFRRQALDRGAALLKVDKLATGHNADDIAETVLLNILRGDIARLGRCTSIVTGEDGPIPRCKPFKYTYEKEIVIYPCSISIHL
ncbi:hypothetical protein IFM89_021802 [Coptis chinensis]|uniref:tRNA(Ile)-lysidine/2-thiocytidine synthase N-terminal domain-containing protein n=1 Tax=Coptis chinensis TaxID=261450 RepID=A0A835IR92_9MAGN|nr:hypothetical protein IFM89_021802 [Coptis chinensis]